MNSDIDTVIEPQDIQNGLSHVDPNTGENVGDGKAYSQQPGPLIQDARRSKVANEGVPLFNRARGNAAVEVTGNVAIRGIDRLQEAVRRHTGSRAARISKSMSLDDLESGKGRGGSGAANSWRVANTLAGFFGQTVITFENHTPGIFDFNWVELEGIEKKRLLPCLGAIGKRHVAVSPAPTF